MWSSARGSAPLPHEAKTQRVDVLPVRVRDEEYRVDPHGSLEVPLRRRVPMARDRRPGTGLRRVRPGPSPTGVGPRVSATPGTAFPGAAPATRRPPQSLGAAHNAGVGE